MKKSNIILIGMAGCGKSSVGRLLANRLNRPFLDTDDLIVRAINKPLQDIIDQEGPGYFKQIEQEILLTIHVNNHIIATGGSSVYSQPGMDHLKSKGLVVLLNVALDILKQRVGDVSGRGLVKLPEQSFKELYEERKPLYEKFAELTLECTGLNHHEVCDALIKELQRRGKMVSFS